MKLPPLLVALTTLTTGLATSLSAQNVHPEGLCTARTGPVPISGDFDCLRVPVFEDRERGAGREISLHVVVLPSTGDDPAPDPLFFLPGGPGQASAELAGYVRMLHAAILAERDIVLVDFRGTGDSNGLDFEVTPEDVLASVSDPLPLDIVKRELARLEERADLTKYTTEAIVDDLDDVREFLGYEKINLWGGSYGTRVALAYLRQHPEHARAAVIKGVAPMGFAIGADFAVDTQRSIEGTFAHCAADPNCASAYGDVSELLDTFLANLDEEPVHVTTRHPLSGQNVDVPLTRNVVLLTIRDMLYSTPEHGQLPRMIAAGASGHLEEWAQKALTGAGQSWGQLYEGMFLSVAAAEDLPLLQRLDLEADGEGTLLGGRFTAPMREALEAWPQGTVDPGFWEPVVSDVPVLLVSGVLDPVTPAAKGAEAARHLANSLHLVFETGSHDDSMFRPCIDRIYADFLRAGTVEGLDVDCAMRERPIRFAID